MTSTIAAKVTNLGFRLPPPSPAAAANYVPVVRSGNLLFVSGQISQLDAGIAFYGRLGDELDVEQGIQAAQVCALCVLAQVDVVVGGDIAKIGRIVRLGVFVAATPTFSQHSQVGNGASDLLAAVLGERGRHARTSIGVASLPLGVAVEVDAIVELVD
jgi:enamine deaminase RidA (YjgF/YER057c/UK114 family)